MKDLNEVLEHLSDHNQACQHKLVHLDTKKNWKSNGYNNKYVRIDNFYCEKCGEIITKNKTDYCREEPDWY